ncbi:MAG: four helix bundle protein [Prevotellaceae bacterium]|jgi:four helix bundle protein|nr:four helix bundle protein [Prevotellaceae bacterium]
MNAAELKKRMQLFAIRIIKLASSLPNNVAGRTIGNQIIRSGTSSGANYRAACIAKSDKDFVNKLKIVEEELDETLYWMELIMEAQLVRKEILNDLMLENEELLKIIISSINTTKNRLSQNSKS